MKKQLFINLALFFVLDLIVMYLLVRLINPSTIDSAIGIIVFIPFIFGVQLILGGILLLKKNKNWGIPILLNSIIASFIFVQLYSINIDKRMDIKFDNYYFNKVDTTFNVRKDNLNNSYIVSGSSGMGHVRYTKGEWKQVEDTTFFKNDNYGFKIYNDTLENFRNSNEINLIRTTYSQDKKQNIQIGKAITISEAMNNPAKTKILDITKKGKYSDFPTEIFDLQNLKELHFGKQNITQIPDDITMLKDLEYLDLRDNKINSINPKICECKNLKDLRIGGPNKLVLPDCLKRMQSLKNLKIQSNNTNELMEQLRGFKNLKTAHFYFYERPEGITFDNEKWWAIEKEMGLNK